MLLRQLTKMGLVYALRFKKQANPKAVKILFPWIKVTNSINKD